LQDCVRQLGVAKAGKCGGDCCAPVGAFGNEGHRQDFLFERLQSKCG